MDFINSKTAFLSPQGLGRCIRLRPAFYTWCVVRHELAMHRRTVTGILILRFLLLVTAPTAPGEGAVAVAWPHR